MPDPVASYGTCTYCGDAFPPGGTACPTCGNPGSVARGASGGLPKRTRYRLRLVQGVRGAIIVGVVVGLAYLMVSAAVTPPPSAPDPLTTSELLWVGPGNFTALSGEITGGDYVVGNYTVVNPPGAPITLLVFNSTAFTLFVAHGPASPLYNASGESSARLLFSAPYTDTYHFVWVNGFAPTTRLVLGIYVVTNYESNALVE